MACSIPKPKETDRLIPCTERSIRHTGQRIGFGRYLLRECAKDCLRGPSCTPRQLCVASKPALLIFAWNFVVSSIYTAVTYGAIHYLEYLTKERESSLFLATLGFYATLALVMVCYPLAGFVADVYCGRYRVVGASLCLLWMCMVIG